MRENSNDEMSGDSESPPAMPSPHVVLVLVSCVLEFVCCFQLLVLGVFALSFSAKVRQCFRNGDYRGARRASRAAFWCGWSGVLLSLIFIATLASRTA